MTIGDFLKSLKDDDPPEGVAAGLRALWHDARGQWEAAHQIAQDIDGATGAWIHAYLHRKEGDIANADYWYRRAGKSPAVDSLQEEWTRLVTELL